MRELVYHSHTMQIKRIQCSVAPCHTSIVSLLGISHLSGGVSGSIAGGKCRIIRRFPEDGSACPQRRPPIIDRFQDKPGSMLIAPHPASSPIWTKLR